MKRLLIVLCTVMACIALLAGASLPSYAKVELASVIGSNMVLQQESEGGRIRLQMHDGNDIQVLWKNFELIEL